MLLQIILGISSAPNHRNSLLIRTKNDDDLRKTYMNYYFIKLDETYLKFYKTYELANELLKHSYTLSFTFTFKHSSIPIKKINIIV